MHAMIAWITAKTHVMNATIVAAVREHSMIAWIVAAVREHDLITWITAAVNKYTMSATVMAAVRKLATMHAGLCRATCFSHMGKISAGLLLHAFLHGKNGTHLPSISCDAHVGVALMHQCQVLDLWQPHTNAFSLKMVFLDVDPCHTQVSQRVSVHQALGHGQVKRQTGHRKNNLRNGCAERLQQELPEAEEERKKRKHVGSGTRLTSIKAEHSYQACHWSGEWVRSKARKEKEELRRQWNTPHINQGRARSRGCHRLRVKLTKLVMVMFQR
eukprot:1160479-Pelagomonas_calceolata.AAC.3